MNKEIIQKLQNQFNDLAHKISENSEEKKIAKKSGAFIENKNKEEPE